MGIKSKITKLIAYGEQTSGSQLALLRSLQRIDRQFFMILEFFQS